MEIMNWWHASCYLEIKKGKMHLIANRFMTRGGQIKLIKGVIDIFAGQK